MVPEKKRPTAEVVVVAADAEDVPSSIAEGLEIGFVSCE